MYRRAVRRLIKQINKALGTAGLKISSIPLEVLDLRTKTEDPLEGFYFADGQPFLIEIPLEKCIGLHTAAFSCTDRYSNPFLSTLVAYQNGTCRSYTDSPLRRFHNQWQPANAAEALGLDTRSANRELVL